MAYMNQARKKQLADNLKRNLKGCKLKYSLRVRHRSAIVMTITEGDIDFFNLRIGEKPHDRYIQVNQYHYETSYASPAKEILTTIFEALNDGNHDRSDIQSDYFDVGWYVDVNIGNWNRPYVYRPSAVAV